MSRFIRWLIGLVSLLVFCLAVFSLPVDSILAWQSPIIKYSFLFLFLCSTFCLHRIFKGPTAADRAVSIDILGILIIGFCVILGIITKRDWYIDIGIAWALQSFIGTLALAKYLEGRNFDE